MNFYNMALWTVGVEEVLGLLE